MPIKLILHPIHRLEHTGFRNTLFFIQLSKQTFPGAYCVSGAALASG